MLPVKKMSGSPSLSMSPIATPPPLYTYGSVCSFKESLVTMVFANVIPVCAGGRSLKRGVRTDRRPQLITATMDTSVATARGESRNMGPRNLTLAGEHGYHSVHVRRFSSGGAETGCCRALLLLADEMPQVASRRGRTTRAYVLCRLPHGSP